MMKYQVLLAKLSLEEKLKLITSNTYIENNQITDYLVPVLNFNFEFKDLVDDFVNPSIESLGSLYDKNLIYKYGLEIGKYLSYKNYKKVINIPCNPTTGTEPSFSSSKLVTARMAASIAKGIEEGGFLCSYGIIPSLKSINLNSYYNDEMYSFKVALGQYKPFACIFDSPDALDIVKEEYNYNGLKVVIAHDISEVITSINHKAELTISKDFSISYGQLLEAANNFVIAKNKLLKQEITPNEFRNMILSANILSVDAIDDALVSLLEKLAFMETIESQKLEYDIENMKNIEYALTRESIVLLKNNGILPLRRENKVAFIGDNIFSPKLNTNKEEINIELDPEAIIDNYHLETVGIAHGYILDQESNDDLLVRAQRLAEDAEYTVVFLTETNGEIPSTQLDLLNNLKEIDTKIIIVISTNKFVDLTPILSYDAIILNPNDSLSQLKACIDVILGRYNPTGRLKYALKSDVEDIYFKSNSNLLFPLGYGLSYSAFNYKSITIDENGIVLAVTNESKLPGTDMLFFTSKYLNGATDELNYIRDFITVDLEPHESKIVEFSFDFNSFSIYDIDKGESIIREGKYLVQLMTSFNNILSSKEVNLNYLKEKAASTETLEKNYSDLMESIDDLSSDIEPKKNYVALPIKIVSIVLISIYLFILCLVFTINIKEVFPKVILILLMLVIIGVDVFLIVSNARKPKENDKASDLTDMVNSFEEFNVELHETFEEPVPVVEEEEVEEIVEEEEEEVAPQKVFIYDAYGEEIVDNLEYSNHDTIEEIVDRFTKYALNKGVMIESIYAKKLFASILSNNMVLVSGSTKEKNVQLIKILNDFFGNNKHFYMDLKDKQQIDVYWDFDKDNNYKLSSFTNNIMRFNHLPKRFNIIAFDNVDDNNIELIKEYIDFASTPKENHNIDLGEGYSLTLAPNTVIIVFVDNKLNNKDLYNNSVSLDLTTSNNEVIDEEVSLMFNDYQYLKSLIDASKNKYYLPEEIWKKMDRIFNNEIFFNFKLNNKHLTVCEKLVGILMELKDDENQALNSIFIMKIIPILLSIESDYNPSFRHNIVELFENEFDDRLESAIRYYKNS